MDKNKIINDLVREGAKHIKNLKVMRVTNYQDKDEREKLCLTLRDAEVPAFVPNDDDDFVEGTTNTIHVFANQVIAVLEENDDYCAVMWRYRKSPEKLQTLLAGATIDVLGEHVLPTNDDDPDDKGYRNPFSRKEKFTKVEHEQWFYSVVNVVLTQTAINRLKDLYNELS